MNTLESISHCIEFGKIDAKSPFPPNMKGQDGADELTKKAIEEGIAPFEILNKAMIPAMEKVGQKFSEKKIFIPQMLMSAKTMTKALEHIKPFFKDGSVQQKGTFIIGTVFGDLHDIGKNLVAMMVEGNGWNVIDLGVDVPIDKFIKTINDNPGCVVGLSALLTTTILNMETIVKEIKTSKPEVKITIGGAPVNDDFCKKIGADNYALKGLVVAALAAAIVSSLASMVNSTSTIFTMDIYKPYFERKNGKNRDVLIGRIAGGAALFIAVIVAPALGNVEQAFQYIQEYTGLVSPGILAVFLLGLFYKKATNKGAISGILVSIPVALALKSPTLELPWMDQVMYTLLITIVVIVFVSLETNPESDDKKAIHLTKEIFETGKPFTLASYAICIILVVLYTVFW